MKFEDFNLNDKLILAIKKLGINEPTEIQEKSIPYVLEGKDIIGESATGSGKTLIFGCGIIEKINHERNIQALILTPTRELAEQIKEALKELSYQKPLNITAVYGGVSINKQIYDLTKADVVVATPGRLLDHLQRRTINISKIKLLILDEADRMLDMGFIEDIEKIIKNCSSERQTLLFSATIPAKVRNLANKYMNKAIKVSAEKMVDPNKLKQVYYNVQNNMKLSLLAYLLQNEKTKLAMVFCNTRKTADFVAKSLRVNNIKAVAIHGGLSQNKRSNTIKLFNGAKEDVLICTDVAARGLHISNVSHIYNYDTPKEPNDYIHRIGRTARAGEEGKVINLLCDNDHDNFSRILSEYRTFSIGKIEKPYVKRIIAAKTDNFDKPRRFNNNTNRPRRFNNNSNQPRRFNNSRGSVRRFGNFRRFGNRK